MTSIVGERGQVTIPKQLRDALGLHPGDRVDFALRDGTVVLRPVEEDPFAPLIGILKGDGRTVDEIIDELRGPVSADLRRRYRDSS